MTTPIIASPDGDTVYDPKILGQSSRVRTQISQNSTTRVGLQVVVNGVNVDADTYQATIYQKIDFRPGADLLGTATEVDPSKFSHEEAGVYSFALDPTITAALSQIAVHWQYTIGENTYQYWDFFEILGYMPTFESLTDSERIVVATVSWMFEDLYDSAEGGPHLGEQFQTHFGAERVAQLMSIALTRINTMSQPITNYTLGALPGSNFPANHISVLVMGTYLEVVRHLVRSYVEMPAMQGSPGVAFFDRSNYQTRWTAILKDESDDYRTAVRLFKRKLMNLGSGNLIVGGGIFGSISGFRSGQYSAAARAAKFTYPASIVRVSPSPSG